MLFSLSTYVSNLRGMTCGIGVGRSEEIEVWISRDRYPFQHDQRARDECEVGGHLQ